MAKAIVLPVGAIEENQNALRSTVDKESLKYEQLKASIKQYGLIDSISVTEYQKEDGTTGYKLVNGLHRLTALQELGIPEVSCNVVTVQEGKLLALQIIGNTTNVPTTKSQLAEGIKQLIQFEGLTNKEVAAQLNKTEREVKAILNLTNLPEKIVKLVDEGALNVQNAGALLALPKDKIEEYVEQAMTESPSTFVPKMNELGKELKAAARSGRAPNIEFVPQVKVRKTSEFKAVVDEFNSTGTTSALKSLIDLAGLTDPVAAAVLAVQWALSLDPVSVAAGKARFDAEAKEKAEAKAAREKERADKKNADAKAKLQTVTTS